MADIANGNMFELCVTNFLHGLELCTALILRDTLHERVCFTMEHITFTSTCSPNHL